MMELFFLNYYYYYSLQACCKLVSVSSGPWTETALLKYMQIHPAIRNLNMSTFFLSNAENQALPVAKEGQREDVVRIL